MRKQFDSLAEIVSGTLEEDPYSGHLYVFCNKLRNRLKILLWDRSGFVIVAKRLEKGTFAWPEWRTSVGSSTKRRNRRRSVSVRFSN